MKTTNDVIREADLRRTGSVFFHPLMSAGCRRAALADMDEIIRQAQASKKEAIANGRRRFRVSVSTDAAMALKNFIVFKNTPERATFLKRLQNEAGIPPGAIRFITRLVEDTENGSRGGQMWEAEMHATFLEVRLPESLCA